MLLSERAPRPEWAELLAAAGVDALAAAEGFHTVRAPHESQWMRLFQQACSTPLWPQRGCQLWTERAWLG